MPAPDLQPSWQSGFARSAAEAEHPNLWQGLQVAWIPLLGYTGARIFDCSYAAASNGVLTNVSWLPSKGFPSCFYFDGRAAASGEVKAEANVANLPIAALASFSLAFWYRSLAVVSLAHIFGFGQQLPSAGVAGTQRGVLQYLSNVYFWGASADWNTGIAWPTDNAWHHFCFTFQQELNNPGRRFYLDGIDRASANTPVSLNTAATYVTAGGRHNSAAGAPNGYFGGGQIWNRRLTNPEAQQLFSDPFAPVRLRRRVYKAAVVAPPSTGITLNLSPAGGSGEGVISIAP